MSHEFFSDRLSGWCLDNAVCVCVCGRSVQAHCCVKIRTDVQRALYNLYVRVAVWVHVCTHTHTCLSTSLIQRGINPIHYLAGLRAAQSMALSVAADELPFLTRCIIQTCRRARGCLAFQSIRETEGQKFYLRETKYVSTLLKACPRSIRAL